MRLVFVTAIVYLIFTLHPAAAKMAGCCQKPTTEAQFRGGKIYELNSEKKNLLFTINADLQTSEQGVSIFSSSYVNTDGHEILAEQATFDQLDLRKYVIQQKQLNELYELNVADGKITFTVSKNDRITKNIIDLPTNLIIGPSFVPFLKLHWKDIQDHKKVKAQLAVLERLETYGFEFEKIRNATLNSEAAVLVRMKPSNTLISSVVRPVYFTVKDDGSRILEIKGRMLPKRKFGSQWEDFEAEAFFSY